VALSADGNTAIVGGMGDDHGAGAAWIFTRSEGAWTQQGAKLIGSGAVGAAAQGRAVALSGDGNTALIGGSADDHNHGGAWIFTRSSGSWGQQGGKLVGSGASGTIVYQGYGATLSGDGSTAVIGGYGDNGGAGAVWIFTRMGDAWSQSGEKLPAPTAAGMSAQFGYSASLSSDGNRLLIGGPNDAGGAGAIWEYRRIEGLWSQPGKLVGGGASGTAQQGYAVAISADGSTALSGATFDSAAAGAAWSFVDRSGTSARTGHGLEPRTTSPTDYVSTVLATNPMAYFRLEAANDTSLVNGFTSTFQGGATLASTGAPICEPNNHSVSLDGQTLPTSGLLFPWAVPGEAPCRSLRTDSRAGAAV
jgi:hypothetical protein